VLSFAGQKWRIAFSSQAAKSLRKNPFVVLIRSATFVINGLIERRIKAAGQKRPSARSGHRPEATGCKPEAAIGKKRPSARGGHRPEAVS